MKESPKHTTNHCSEVHQCRPCYVFLDKTVRDRLSGLGRPLNHEDISGREKCRQPGRAWQLARCEGPLIPPRLNHTRRSHSARTPTSDAWKEGPIKRADRMSSIRQMRRLFLHSIQCQLCRESPAPRSLGHDLVLPSSSCGCICALRCLPRRNGKRPRSPSPAKDFLRRRQIRRG